MLINKCYCNNIKNDHVCIMKFNLRGLSKLQLCRSLKINVDDSGASDRTCEDD